MPIESHLIQDENILIVKLIGFIPATEISQFVADEIFERVNDNPEKFLNIIYDVTEFEWTFVEFANYLKAYTKPKPDNIVNIVQEHYVGKSQWIANLRTWWKQHAGKDTTAFTTVEDALEYIRRKAKQDGFSA